jgi:hypothetical protein
MDLKKQKISVLVVNYNQDQNIHALLSNLKTFFKGLNYEVLVFDNSNTLKKSSDYKLFSLQKNIGYGSAINYLATKAIGDYFLITNNDLAYSGFFKKYFSDFLKTPVNVGVLSLDKAQKLYKAPILNLFSSKKRFSGHSFLVEKHVFKALGGFDNNFFMYLEDDDFAKELEKFDIKTEYLTKFVVNHTKQYRYLDAKRRFYYYSSVIYYLKKHNKISYFIFFIPLSILKYFYKLWA